MVRAAYGSGKPAYGVGAGNATMVIDETADIAEAARNTRISKTNDYGSGCSADGNLLVDATIYDALLDAAAEGGRLPGQRPTRRRCCRRRLLGRGRPSHAPTPSRARAADRRARPASRFPTARRSSSSPAKDIGKAASVLHRETRRRARRSSNSSGFDEALEMVQPDLSKPAARATPAASIRLTTSIFIAWRCMAPVSRIMVRQPQSKANAGAFTNGMPMTSSMGCGVWGGNITNENISLKHYMNVTWVSRPIAEDRPSGAGIVRRILQQPRSDVGRSYAETT